MQLKQKTVLFYILPILESAATRTFPPPSMKLMISGTLTEPPKSSF